jgi:hypothetical protein
MAETLFCPGAFCQRPRPVLRGEDGQARCGYCKRALESPEPPEASWREAVEAAYKTLLERVEGLEPARKEWEARQEARVGDLEAGGLLGLDALSHRVGQVEAGVKAFDALAERVSLLVGEVRDQAEAGEALTRRVDGLDDRSGPLTSLEMAAKADRRANEERFRLIAEGLGETDRRLAALQALAVKVQGLTQALDRRVDDLDNLVVSETVRTPPPPPPPPPKEAVAQKPPKKRSPAPPPKAPVKRGKPR